jgi:hypothetical protein
MFITFYPKVTNFKIRYIEEMILQLKQKKNRWYFEDSLLPEQAAGAVAKRIPVFRRYISPHTQEMERSITYCPLTRPHIPKNWNPQLYFCKNLNNRKYYVVAFIKCNIDLKLLLDAGVKSRRFITPAS